LKAAQLVTNIHEGSSRIVIGFDWSPIVPGLARQIKIKSQSMLVISSEYLTQPSWFSVLTVNLVKSKPSIFGQPKFEISLNRCILLETQLAHCIGQLIGTQFQLAYGLG
jgi:hypothetical protein